MLMTSTRESFDCNLRNQALRLKTITLNGDFSSLKTNTFLNRKNIVHSLKMNANFKIKKSTKYQFNLKNLAKQLVNKTNDERRSKNRCRDSKRTCREERPMNLDLPLSCRNSKKVVTPFKLSNPHSCLSARAELNYRKSKSNNIQINKCRSPAVRNQSNMFVDLSNVERELIYKLNDKVREVRNFRYTGFMSPCVFNKIRLNDPQQENNKLSIISNEGFPSISYRKARRKESRSFKIEHLFNRNHELILDA